MSQQRCIIVGGGPAGLYAADALRFYDPEAQITLVSAEAPYARIVLPYYLKGEVERDHLLIGGPASFERLKVEPILGASARRLDPQRRLLMLSDGQVLAYDKLLLATGSRPTLPPIPGTDLPGVHTFWTLADAEAVLRAAAGRPEVLLIGAGFIGLIVLTAMFKIGWRLHVAEVLPHILPRMLDGPAAAMVTEWLRGRGVDVLTSAQVNSIEYAPSGRKRVVFAGLPALEVDLVIIAAGVRPNLALAEAAGLAVDHGILVDAHLRTSHPEIFAAGDVAQGPDLLESTRRVHAIQPTAHDHGRIAGANMAGQEITYRGSLLMNILEVAGMHCVSLGRWEGEPPQAVRVSAQVPPLYRKLVWEGSTLVGGILLGPSPDLTLLSDAGMVKGIIQSRAHLGNWREYLQRNPWDVRRPFTAARVGEQLLGKTLLPGPSRPRLHRYQNLEPALAPRPSYVQMMEGKPDHLVLPSSAPPLR